jgi:hypothetical protein
LAAGAERDRDFFAVLVLDGLRLVARRAGEAGRCHFGLFLP